MLPYCLESLCRKIQKVETEKLQRKYPGRIMLYQNVRFVVVKNLDLLKNKKLVDY